MLIRNAAVVHVLRVLGTLATLAGAACDTPHDGPVNDLGEVSVGLVVDPGTTINTATFLISGPQGFSRGGAIDVSRSGTLSTTVLALPPGIGFTISLTAAVVGGGACAGTTTFDIASHQQTAVVVPILCHEGARLGSALLTGDINICPTLDGVTAVPSTVNVGQSTTVAVVAHDPDVMPAALQFAWSAPTGTFSAPAAAVTQFTCTTAGTVTIGIALNDGDLSAGCPVAGAVNVVCN